MTRIVLFGAGLAAPPIIEKVLQQDEILAVADNDSAKWGKRLQGLPIISPQEIANLSPDKIVISSTATYPIFLQLLELGFPADAISSELTHPSNRQSWNSLKNSQSGKRIFIVGNGPSLRIEDLETIHRHRDLSFAFNKIYLAFPRSPYRPSYYLVEDDLVAKNNQEKIRALSGFPKFFPDYLLPILGPADDQTTLFHFDVQAPERFTPRFSTEPLLLHSGYTCTYSAIQLATWMGCDPIITIGLDFSFTLPAESDSQILTNENERNHFHPDYRKTGESWNRPYLQQSEQAYKLANQVALSKGSRILNASRSTQLETFPRVDFDSLF
ncbi:hypothetical protein VDG1235_3187 [Verrucomicrobiia bacterium DG1235]|nr:hypothetical protein VDG1235_3187 [Verrucomicrobiae bacterium DG1235]